MGFVHIIFTIFEGLKEFTKNFINILFFPVQMDLLALVIVISVLALLFAGWLTRHVLKKDKGTAAMQEDSNAIKVGAEAFVKRQYTTIGIYTIILAIIIYAVYAFLGKTDLGWRTSVAFLFGAISSAVAGVVSMLIAVRANIRTASAAKRSLNEAFVTALRGGAVAGIIIVSMSLLGVALIYYFFSIGIDPKQVPFLIVGYGFGASFVALFAQLGGGIYTKAADVGSDLVGKVEKGIPEDDPRNPAVIADLVGDNVGDCAGRGADLFESTAAENIGAMILGVALYPYFGLSGVLFPLVVRAFGLIASMIGIMTVKLKNENENPMGAINRSYYITSILAAIAFFITTKWLLYSAAKPSAWIWFFFSGLVGIITSILIVLITVYYTESDPFFFKNSPVKKIAKASLTGHATNIITGIAVGLESTAVPVVVLCAALLISFKLGSLSGLAHGGLYGTAMATMGMLGTAAFVLAMDTFGPITDNAGGIAEMSKAPEDVRKRTDRLDAVGNTTKAITKGYAVGSAALAAFLLFSAYLDDVKSYLKVDVITIDISKVPVFVGAFFGATLIFLFSSLAIRAVGDAAFSIVNEVRRQWKSNKGIMTGKEKPDYAKVVDICVRASLKKMILPGLLVVVTTIVVGMTLKYEAAAAFLMVATITGILMALFFNNSGGAWDNAKKYIEEGNLGGKGSEAHKAAVTGDTVGDPYKDTAGPSLHVLIKLLSTITLVLVPLFV